MRKLYTLLFLVSVVIYSKAQDVHFSMYGEAPLMVNPALTAVHYDLRAVANYRDQWTGSLAPFKTYAASLEGALRHKKLGRSHLSTGLGFFNDNSGDAQYKTTNVNLNLGAVVKVASNGELSLGTQFAYVQNTINYDNLKWGTQFDGYKYDPARASYEFNQIPSAKNFDLAAGINYHFSKSNLYISSKDGSRFDAGLAAFHLLQPKNGLFTNSVEKTNIRTIGYFNGMFCKKGSKTCFLPGIFFINQGANNSILGSFMIKYIITEQTIYTNMKKPFAFSYGVQYRLKDAFIPTILLEWDKYAIGAAYDLTLSTMNNANKGSGGFEVMLRYNWNPGYGRMVGGSLTKPTFKN